MTNPRAASSPPPPSTPPRNLSTVDVGALLKHSLKPEEISGEQREFRVRELLWWFSRLTRQMANPKWTVPHAYELAYYIATSAPPASPETPAMWAYDEIVRAYPAAVTSTPRAALSALIAEFARLKAEQREDTELLDWLDTLPNGICIQADRDNPQPLYMTPKAQGYSHTRQLIRDARESRRGK